MTLKNNCGQLSFIIFLGLLLLFVFDFKKSKKKKTKKKLFFFLIIAGQTLLPNSKLQQ